MNKLLLAVTATLIVSCTRPQLVDRRVSVARGNVSFILPDSTLLHSSWKVFGPDYKGSNYGEFYDFYFNQDSTTRMTVYVEAIPNSNGKWFANEKADRRGWTIKDPGLTIEHTSYDSLTRIVDMNGHTMRRGKQCYTK